MDCISTCDDLALKWWQKRPFCVSTLADPNNPNNTILVGTYVCSRSHGCGEGAASWKERIHFGFSDWGEVSWFVGCISHIETTCGTNHKREMCWFPTHLCSSLTISLSQGRSGGVPKQLWKESGQLAIILLSPSCEHDLQQSHSLRKVLRLCIEFWLELFETLVQLRWQRLALGSDGK